ncbi:hypothetical protein ACFRMN_22790 [Streptomyces sp. NPDC056835]|uniref:hypothetical protein n=1 Tax=Streptomyces sp. NPDC056835 TaxID=3345956 RepID=UPI00367A6498
MAARDSSGRTWQALSALALALLREHAGGGERPLLDWALTTLARLPSRLEAVLRAALLPATAGAPAPAAKVTSRKELVRLAASRLPVGTAAAIVAETFAPPGQHPDVQAACVPVSIELLRSPAAWSLLERASDGPPVTQAAVREAALALSTAVE